MKKFYLLFPLLAVLVYFSMSSYSSGPAGAGLGDRTGARGSTSGCGGGGCHSSSAASGLSVTVALDSAGTTVTHYIAGHSYNIVLTGSNGTGSTLSRFGFQLAAVQASGAGASSAVDGGTLATSGLPSSTHNVAVASTFHLVEHTGRLSPSSGSGTSGSTTYSVSIPWTAPSAGTGSVVLYGIINAVNNDFGTSGDFWNRASAVTITELTASPVVGPITGPSDVCVGTSITLSDTSAGGTWSSSDTTLARINSSGVVTGVAVGSVTITYTTSVGSVYDTITVNPAVAVGIISGPRPRRVCVGSTITLTNSAGSGTWITGSPSIASIDATSGVVTGLSTGTAYISYMVISSVCGPAYALDTVTVIGRPALSAITGAPSVCTGDTVRMSDSASGGTWSVSSTSIATISSTGLVTGLSAGTDTVFYSATNFCGTSRVFQIITVLATPDPGTISGTSPICIGSPVSFTSSGTSGGVWSSANPSVASVSTSGVVSGVSTGTTNISYTLISSTCGSRSAVFPVSVVVSVSAGAISGTSTICAASTSLLSSSVSGGAWSVNPSSVATINPTSGLLTGLSAGSATVSYIVSSVCGSDTATFSMTINARPIGGTIFGASSICLGDSTQLLDTSASSTTGVWSSSSAGVATVNPITGKVYGITAGTTTISYTVSTPSCGTDAATFTFRVNGTPALSPISGPTNVCVGGTALYTDTLAGGRWSTGSTSIATIDTATGMLTGVAAGSVNVIYSLLSACGSASISRLINVNSPASPGTISGPAIMCLGTADTFTVSGGLAGGSWSTSSAAIASVTDTSNGYFAAIALGSVTISYSVASAGCPPSTAVFSSSVATTPSPGSISGPSSVCAGSAVTLTPTISGGRWSSSATSTATVSSISGQVFGVAGGTANITYTVTTICGSAFTVYPFTVLTAPVVSAITGDDSVCEGGATVLLGSSPSGGTWSSADMSIASVAAGSGLVTGVAAGSTTITYSVANTCGTTSVYQTMRVKPLAVAGTISGPTVICTGTSAGLSASVSGGTWSSGATSVASVSSSGSVYGVSAGSAIISYLVSNDCGVVYATYPVTVTATPVLGAISGSSSVCEGSSTAYTYSGTAGGAWSSSNASVASVDATGNVSAVAVGIATISYILNSSCRSDTVTQNISVLALPVSGTISGPSGYCVGATGVVSTTGSGGVWSTSDASVASVDPTGMVTAVAAGSATISYVVTTASCGSSTATLAVAVANTPFAGTVTGTASVCEAAAVSFSTTATGGLWRTSSPSVATVDASGNVTGVSAGVANISYVVSNACGSDSSGATITVNPLPVAGGISGPSTVCPGSSVTLFHTGAAGVWSSGSPSIATIDAGGTVTGVAAGSSVISYAVTNGCGTAYATYVEVVSPLPDAGSISGVASLCTGTSGVLSSTTGGGVWSSSDATIASVDGLGNAYGVATGTVTITYIYTNSCGSDTTTYPLTINTTASVGAISGPTVVCEAASISLSNSTSGGTWSSSATSIATVNTSGVVFGVAGGAAVISYSLTTSCGTAVATYNITVNPLPVVSPITGSDSVCLGSTVSLFDATSGGVWSVSDPSIVSVSTSGAMTGLSVGTATVSYTVTNGCGAVAATMTARVLPLPSAGTVSGASSVCTGSTITLTSTVSGGAWSSSAASVASVTSSGIVVGITTGSADITYTYTNSCGVATASTNITVNTTPSVASIAGAAFVCLGSTTTLTNSTSGGTWTSSSTSVASVHPVTGDVIGLSVGTTTISYTVTNVCGSTTVTQALSVNSTPFVSAIAGPSSVCPGATITLTDATAGGSWISGSPSVATIDASGVVTGVTAGTATISYMVVAACGTGYSFANITVNALPFSGTVSGASTVCIGAAVTLSPSVSGGVWSSSAPSVASVSTAGLVSGLASGSSNIIYSVTNVCGTASSAHTVTVIAPADAGVISGPSAVCRSSSVTLASTVSGGAWSSSSSAIAVVSSAGVVTGVGFGTAVISYTVTNSCGASSATYAISVDASVASGGSITGRDIVCVGDTTTYIAPAPGGRWRAVTGNLNLTSSGFVTAVSEGVDTIFYTLANACGSSVTMKVVTILSSDDCTAGINSGVVGAPIVTIAPNPSEGMFYVDVPADGRKYEIVVADISGKIVLSYTTNTGETHVPVNMDHAASGSYIVKVASGEMVIRKKITLFR